MRFLTPAAHQLRHASHERGGTAEARSPALRPSRCIPGDRAHRATSAIRSDCRERRRRSRPGRLPAAAERPSAARALRPRPRRPTRAPRMHARHPTRRHRLRTARGVVRRRASRRNRSRRDPSRHAQAATRPSPPCSPRSAAAVPRSLRPIEAEAHRFVAKRIRPEPRLELFQQRGRLRLLPHCAQLIPIVDRTTAETSLEMSPECRKRSRASSCSRAATLFRRRTDRLRSVARTVVRASVGTDSKRRAGRAARRWRRSARVDVWRACAVLSSSSDAPAAASAAKCGSRPSRPQ